MHVLEYLENVDVFLFHRRQKRKLLKRINNFSKLKPYGLSQYADQVCFHWNQSLRVKLRNKEESRKQIDVNPVNVSLWLLKRKAFVVKILTKFLKNYLKGKSAF